MDGSGVAHMPTPPTPPCPSGYVYLLRSIKVTCTCNAKRPISRLSVLFEWIGLSRLLITYCGGETDICLLIAKSVMRMLPSSLSSDWSTCSSESSSLPALYLILDRNLAFCFCDNDNMSLADCHMFGERKEPCGLAWLP